MNASQFQGPAPFDAVINEAAKLRAIHEQGARSLVEKRREALMRDVSQIDKDLLDGRKNRFPWAEFSIRIQEWRKEGKTYDWILNYLSEKHDLYIDKYVFISSVNKKGLNK